MMSMRKAGRKLGGGLAAALAAAMLMQSAFVCAAEATETETEVVTEAQTTEETTEEATEESTEETTEADTEEETDASAQEETEALEQPVATGFDMSTAYPGIVMKAGETGSFSLDFTSLTGDAYDASLTVTELPDGWTGYFKGSSGQISKVHIPGGSTDALGESSSSSSNTVTFSLSVPDDAANGTYQIRLDADAGTGSDGQILEVTIDEEETGASNFTSEYPEQQGATGTTFTFDTTIVNNRGTNQTYSLSASAPDGWQVTFTPSGESTNVASVDVDAGGSQGLTVTVMPTENVEKGDYTVSCSAVSANDTLSTDLSVGITGTYGVTLSTPSGLLSLDAYANKETTVTLSITNSGNVDLENLNLTSSAPTDWEVSFDESTIDLLEAGATKEVTAHITPTDNVITGDYVTQISISNNETSSSASFRVSVKTSTTWGIAAVAIIVVLLLGLSAIIKKYGRR